ncbi:acyl-CoA dehydrogenase [Cupriavidus gilardii CR3]|uniref:Acyl-CoA dehydrogenase n=1 Tax=Cupriavidus gilardii TaxID=82541 RepID=A0A849B789_9BURK|nr:acyl-CoA dehydrogenase family protein [Cupriavidus gilardii]ALD92488.1 acyl-CoA dehydrogenase [Cupriavidus gilardii CR3]KAB0596449.1 acyl-CoA dehydrogenase [Cupriavidus gilardii]MCT9016605.1 acyl-CoA/acyl-ACP dehydrogenase [Cupriavidus gilardii]MCT9052972.1 acyl-CoA/acyl-ACP dehydrogenase [Cupriavidus gilardii]NNH10018.1 acyl-CoA dehydrogenase [Cupriavidus gilardii]
MAIVLNDTQDMLRDNALTFLRENAPISALRAMRDSGDPVGFSRELWQRFADLGLAGVLVPEAYGGSGLGVVEAGVIMEAIGRTLAPSPFLSTAVLGASLLTHFGNDAQRDALLPAIAAGRHLTALALDEAGKHRPFRLSTRATADAGGYRIDGSKQLVVDGHVADTLIVAARTADAQAGQSEDTQGITLLLVPRTSRGVRIERVVLADATQAARIVFEGVQVPADAVLGDVDGGGAILERALDIGRAVLSSELLGIADEAFARTLAYLKERRQFGKIIGEFQALQHRAAHLFTELELTRAIVLRCQQRLDESAPDGPEALASAAKAKAGETATLAVQEGVQMHGGIGMTDEFEIGFFMKRARTAQEWLGDANFHADRWARLRGY